MDAATTFYAHPFTLTFEQVTGVEGVFQNRPFFGPSNRPGGQSRIVSAPIPLAPLTSLAQLQNLPLLPIEALNWSGYYYQNHAIGNSFASPGLTPTSIRETSFPFHLGQYFPWQGGDIAGQTYDDRTWFNSADYVVQGAPAMVVDRSYAANHLLFDDYFFSSMAAQEGPVFEKYGTRRALRAVVEDFFSGRKPLPDRHGTSQVRLEAHGGRRLQHQLDFGPGMDGRSLRRQPETSGHHGPGQPTERPDPR